MASSLLSNYKYHATSTAVVGAVSATYYFSVKWVYKLPKAAVELGDCTASKYDPLLGSGFGEKLLYMTIF